MQGKNNKIVDSFGEKIANILTPVPKVYDPEDDDNEDTVAKLVDNDLEEDNSDDTSTKAVGKFNRQTFDLLEDVDKRYEGEKSSRKHLEDQLSVDSFQNYDADEKIPSDSNASDDSEGELRDDEKIPSDNNESDDSEGEQSKDVSEDETENEDNSEILPTNETVKDFKHISSTDTKSQISKGASVINQLKIWESLVELRIQMQKSLVAANKMPQNDHFEEIKENSGLEFTNKMLDTKRAVMKTLDKLMLLQDIFLKKYPETKNLNKNEFQNKSSQEIDEEIPSDTDEEIEESFETENEVPKKKMKLMDDYEKEISKKHNIYRDYRFKVIDKWNEKTKLSNIKSVVPVYSVINQIEHILSNKEKLLKRTQLKRCNYEILGQKSKSGEENNLINEEMDKPRIIEEYNANIFDDDDFYHHLLRELIEFKSSDVSDPTKLGQQWVQLQNLRSKMKRKIDTRATKGRKVRYTVHTKLVNFMAPIDEEVLTDEAKNELFNSLFRKNVLVS